MKTFLTLLALLIYLVFSISAYPIVVFAARMWPGFTINQQIALYCFMGVVTAMHLFAVILAYNWGKKIK